MIARPSYMLPCWLKDQCLSEAKAYPTWERVRDTCLPSVSPSFLHQIPGRQSQCFVFRTPFQVAPVNNKVRSYGTLPLRAGLPTTTNTMFLSQMMWWEAVLCLYRLIRTVCLYPLKATGEESFPISPNHGAFTESAESLQWQAGKGRVD